MPILLSVGQLASDTCPNLRLQMIHHSLAALGGSGLSTLTVAQRRRLLNGRPAAQAELDAFDANLFFALRSPGDHLFFGNTNVTYPMKSILLLTGFMPALDSQVRKGLQRGGFIGMDRTRYLLPYDGNHADGRKIASLPFLLGECWAACSQQLQEGIAESSFPTLGQEPGRIFDVLLFMQSNPRLPVLVTYDPPGLRWYELI
jgi:hypothetical protein